MKDIIIITVIWFTLLQFFPNDKFAAVLSSLHRVTYPGLYFSFS